MEGAETSQAVWQNEKEEEEEERGGGRLVTESPSTSPNLSATQRGLMLLLWMAVLWLEKQLGQSEPFWAGQMQIKLQSCARFRQTVNYNGFKSSLAIDQVIH